MTVVSGGATGAGAGAGAAKGDGLESMRPYLRCEGHAQAAGVMSPPLSLFNETPCLACAGSDLSPPLVRTAP